MMNRDILPNDGGMISSESFASEDEGNNHIISEEFLQPLMDVSFSPDVLTAPLISFSPVDNNPIPISDITSAGVECHSTIVAQTNSDLPKTNTLITASALSGSLHESPMLSMIKTMVARLIQGKSSTLNEIIALVSMELTAIYEKIKLYSSTYANMPNSSHSHNPSTNLDISLDGSVTSSNEFKPLFQFNEETNTASSLVPSPQIHHVAVYDSNRTADIMLLTQYLNSPSNLAELIKMLAERKSYGGRPEKASMFDDNDIFSVNRWEVISMQYFRY